MDIKNNKKITRQDKAPTLKPKGLFQLNLIRERQKKQKECRINKPYFAPTGVELTAILLQEQNRQLLEKVAELKDLADEDKEILFKRFWNVSYWIPKPTKDIKKEK